jgi:hypothetical protein
MNAIEAIAADCDHAPETIAAEVTEAVFPVALRYGVSDLWLDLELDLWHVLAETVGRWDGPLPCLGRASEFEGKALLEELTDAAYRTALRHGARRSVPQSGPGLYQAVRSAVGATVRGRERVPA